MTYKSYKEFEGLHVVEKNEEHLGPYDILHVSCLRPDEPNWIVVCVRDGHMFVQYIFNEDFFEKDLKVLSYAKTSLVESNDEEFHEGFADLTVPKELKGVTLPAGTHIKVLSYFDELNDKPIVAVVDGFPGEELHLQPDEITHREWRRPWMAIKQEQKN